MNLSTRPSRQVAVKPKPAHENDLTKHHDRVNAERRRLPIVKIEKDYIFEGPNGKPNLRDLFEGRKQLIVYHSCVVAPSMRRGRAVAPLAASLFMARLHVNIFTPDGRVRLPPGVSSPCCAGTSSPRRGQLHPVYGTRSSDVRRFRGKLLSLRTGRHGDWNRVRVNVLVPAGQLGAALETEAALLRERRMIPLAEQPRQFFGFNREPLVNSRRHEHILHAFARAAADRRCTLQPQYRALQTCR
jgi:hypothetical protein